MASTHLSQTISSSTGKKFTMSTWIKKTANDNINQIFHLTSDNNTHKYIDYATKSGYGVDFQLKNGSGGTYLRRRLTRIFRDPSAWYHVVIRFDSTQGSAGDRLRIYINGEQATDIDVDSTPDVPQDYVTEFNTNGSSLLIGKNPSGGGYYFDGLMSHFHLCDGYSYAPTEFGETDSTTGIWKFKSQVSVSYGTNGFYIFKDGNNLSGTTVQDQSGQGNDFTATGNLTSMKDCPDNVFAVLNDNVRTSPSQPTLSHANNTQTPNAGAYQNAFSTLGMTGSGKYYWEIKVNGTANSANYMGISNLIEFDNRQQSGNVIGANTKSYSVSGSSGDKRTNDSNTSYGSTFADGDIMMGALDLDNGKIFFGKNGSWFDSGNPATGANPAFSSISASEVYLLGATVYNGGYTSINWNFGNGYFGTTAITTNSNNGYSGAEGSSKFNYQPPTGFSALSTKGLNE